MSIGKKVAGIVGYAVIAFLIGFWIYVSIGVARNTPNNERNPADCITTAGDSC